MFQNGTSRDRGPTNTAKHHVFQHLLRSCPLDRRWNIPKQVSICHEVRGQRIHLPQGLPVSRNTWRGASFSFRRRGALGGAFSSRGPCPANKLLHTYPPPYTFFHLPSSTLIRFHHFSTFLSVHLIRFFIIIFPKFLPSFSPSSSPHSFHQLPSKMSFPQSPHLIHFKKIFFAKYIAKNICHQKKTRTV